MRKIWVKAAIIFSILCWSCIQASANSVFSYAQINVPFEVRVDGTWIQVIEDQEDWEAFYAENAQNYYEPDSEFSIPPEKHSMIANKVQCDRERTKQMHASI